MEISTGDLVEVIECVDGVVGYPSTGLILQHNPTAEELYRWTILVEGEVRAYSETEINKVWN